MTTSISSFVLSKLSATTVNSFLRVFTFDNSAVLSMVEFDSIAYDAREIIGGDFNLKAEGTALPRWKNLLSSDKVKFFKEGIFEFGFVTDSGTNDVTEFFRGDLYQAEFTEDGLVDLQFRNLLYSLNEKEVGSVDSPVDFTGSNYNPADLAWTIQVSYGLLSNIKSTSNPDVDYTSWNDWWSSFNGDSITVQGYFTGESVPEALEKIRDLTDSTIYEGPENKLFYARWTGSTSETHVVADSHILSAKILETAGSIVNQVVVNRGYDPTSDSWAGTITRANTDSVNSYGTHELVYDDKAVWYTTSQAAINQADRVVYRRKEPNISATVGVNFDFLDSSLDEIGENVEFSYGMFGIDRKQMTLIGMEFDFMNFKLTLDIDEGFGYGPGRAFGFILDDVYWGLLDQSYNPLF